MSVYIDAFNFKTIPMLPTVYDDSLSYIEVLSRLSRKVNEVIDRVNSFEEDIYNTTKEYVDNKIATEIAILKGELEQFKQNITAQQNGFEQNVNGAINNINQRIEEFNRTIQANYAAMQAYTNNAIERNNEYIFDRIGQGLLDIRVVNLFTGQKVTVQEMFDYLANFHLTNAITVSRIADLQRTVNTVISYGTVNGKTCTDIVTDGYAIFGN